MRRNIIVRCQTKLMISEVNWQKRRNIRSATELGVKVMVGDICYIDFGKAYVYEVGYQHFGLIISFHHGKAFVVPMTSNSSTYALAYDEYENPTGREHLMRIGLVPGLVKPSVLFLNDAKFINTARIIDVKAHIDADSMMFQKIVRRLRACIGI